MDVEPFGLLAKRFYPKSVDPLDQGKKTLKEMSECCSKYVKLIF